MAWVFLPDCNDIINLDRAYKIKLFRDDNGQLFYRLTFLSADFGMDPRLNQVSLDYSGQQDVAAIQAAINKLIIK